MKKIIAIITALAVAVGVFAVSLSYRNKKNEEHHQQLMSVTTKQTQESKISTDPVVVTDDNEYKLYIEGNIVNVVKGEHKIRMNNWVDSFNRELPKAVSKDIDGDGEKELLLKVNNGTHINVDKSESTLYAVFLFDPTVDENNKKTFETVVANTNTWTAPFANTVRAEVTQLKSCKKILQFSMDNLENQLRYDSKGLATGNYVGYAAALSDKSKNYYTYDNWTLDQGIYDMDDDGNITLKIQVIATYKETTAKQIMGFINCKIQFDDGMLSIVPKQISFTANDPFRVRDPRNAYNGKWSASITNTASRPDFQDNVIDWIDCDFDVSAINGSQNSSFSNMPSKIKCVDKIDFTESSITLTAKEGYTFYKNPIESGDFAVVINEGKNDETDISYTCEIKNTDSAEKLVITLDGAYSKSELKTAVIKFGA